MSGLISQYRRTILQKKYRDQYVSATLAARIQSRSSGGSTLSWWRRRRALFASAIAWFNEGFLELGELRWDGELGFHHQRDGVDETLVGFDLDAVVLLPGLA